MEYDIPDTTNWHVISFTTTNWDAKPGDKINGQMALMDWGLKGAYVFRRLTHDDNYPICSWVVAYAYDAAGRRFGVDPGAADPDDIWDYVTSHPEEYRQIRDLVPLPETM